MGRGNESLIMKPGSPDQVKTTQKSSPPEPAGQFSRNSVSPHLGLQPIIACTYDDPKMTLVYFTASLVLET